MRSGYNSDFHINDNPEAWRFIAKTLRKEFGVNRLTVGLTEGEEVLNFLLSADAEVF